MKKRHFAVVEGAGKDLVGYALDYYPEEAAAYKREMGDAIIGSFATSREADEAIDAFLRQQRAALCRQRELRRSVVEKDDVTTIEPLLCSVAAGAIILGRSKRFIADALARGKIKGVKSDRRTLLIIQSLRDYMAGLPRAKGTPSRRRFVR